MYCVESPRWNLQDINLVVWLPHSRSRYRRGPRMMFGYAEKEDSNTE